MIHLTPSHSLHFVTYCKPTTRTLAFFDSALAPFTSKAMHPLRLGTPSFVILCCARVEISPPPHAFFRDRPPPEVNGGNDWCDFWLGALCEAVVTERELVSEDDFRELMQLLRSLSWLRTRHAKYMRHHRVNDARGTGFIRFTRLSPWISEFRAISHVSFHAAGDW